MRIEGLCIRNIEIGMGMPKICIPVVKQTADEILEYIGQIMEFQPDIIELRMDWYEHIRDAEATQRLLESVRQMAGETVLLFTIRTSNEGGELMVSIEEYMNLCRMACESGCIDLLDVEAFMDDHVLMEIAKFAHEKQVYVIGSNHDFEKTPPEDEITRRLEYMGQQGADIAKIAVMPQAEKDVVTLLQATTDYYDKGNTKPIVTMSMGGTGMISRLVGETFGSAITFASGGEVSAPGQIPVGDVRTMLALLHKYR